MKQGFLTFSQLNGDYLELQETIRCGTPTAVFGVSDSLKYLIASLIPYPIVFVTADRTATRRAAENIATLSGKRVETLVAKDEVLLYRKALSKDSLFKRLEGAYALQTGCPVVVAEIDALLQLFPKTLPTMHLKEGEEIDFSYANSQAPLTFWQATKNQFLPLPLSAS